MGVKILFRIAKTGGLVDKIVALGTWGPVSHCEIMFSDGQCFSSYPGRGVNFVVIGLDPTQWVWFDLPISEQEEAALRAWCEGEVGCWYDYLGAITLTPHNGERWFCAEICIEGLDVNTSFFFRRCMSPNSFYYCCLCKGLHANGGENPSQGICGEFNSHKVH